MAVRVVTGQDGRTWTVRRQMMLRVPATDDFEFEHDVEGGTIGVYVVLGVLVLAAVGLLGWFIPTSFAIGMPLLIKILLGAILAFFPARWLLRRPWQLVAETPGIFDPERAEEKGKEHWVGTVRGLIKVRDETALIINTIKKKGRPGMNDGPMKPNP